MRYEAQHVETHEKEHNRAESGAVPLGDKAVNGASDQGGRSGLRRRTYDERDQYAQEEPPLREEIGPPQASYDLWIADTLSVCYRGCSHARTSAGSSCDSKISL